MVESERGRPLKLCCNECWRAKTAGRIARPEIGEGAKSGGASSSLVAIDSPPTGVGIDEALPVEDT